MNANLWDDHEPASDSADTPTTTDVAGTTSQSPLTAAIEASSWNRADVELGLHVAQVVLLAVWVFLIYNDD